MIAQQVHIFDDEESKRISLVKHVVSINTITFIHNGVDYCLIR